MTKQPKKKAGLTNSIAIRCPNVGGDQDNEVVDSEAFTMIKDLLLVAALPAAVGASIALILDGRIGVAWWLIPVGALSAAVGRFVILRWRANL